MSSKRLNSVILSCVSAFAVTLIVSCERELSDEATEALFSRTADIFIDGPVELGTDFYFPFEGSKPDAASFDGEGYESTASIRIDIPNADDPTGNYAGAIIRVDGVGRDLRQYDALTFYAKASQGIVLDRIGFGADFIIDKYVVIADNLSLGTQWTKYTIPIPDASFLQEERGMFLYSLGTQTTGGLGYTVWFDDLKFESLGTVAQPRPKIQNGDNVITDTFTGVSLPITGLLHVSNLASGADMPVVPSPSFYEFTSSDTSVATVDASGMTTVLSEGIATITASLGGIEAAGSLTINSAGAFVFPNPPTAEPSDVISIFSDYYVNEPVDYYNGFWAPGSTTGSADFDINGDNILNYTNFNYVGTQTANPTVDASEMTHVHFDMYIPGEIPPNFDFLISIEDWGEDQADNGGDDLRQQIFVNAAQVESNTWISIDAELTLTNRDNIGLIIYENINGSTLRNFYIDNIYYYRE